MKQRKHKGTIAYGLAPHEGGTTTVYLQFAQGLRALGWKVFSVAVGERAAQSYDPRFGDAHSVILAPEETDLASQVQAFLEWVEKEEVDIVIPTCEDVIMVAIPHLPQKVRYITICHNVTRDTYIINTLHLDRLSYAVVINKRQIADLQQRWGVPENKLRLIPHGIELEKFLIPRSERPGSELHLIYLGRIEDMAKGVLYLPPLLEKFSAWGIPFTCEVVGSGPDLTRLKNAMARLGLTCQVTFRGQVVPSEIPQLLSQANIFIMPSRFEGFGLSLVEAMAAGCVPIATHLHGITDMIVEDGVSGFLCPMGKVGAFAEKIAFLHHNRDVIDQMSSAARKQAADKFPLERMAEDYDSLFTEALAQPAPPYAPRPLEQLQFPKELLPTWRTKVPMPIKNLARRLLYRYLGRIP